MKSGLKAKCDREREAGDKKTIKYIEESTDSVRGWRLGNTGSNDIP